MVFFPDFKFVRSWYHVQGIDKANKLTMFASLKVPENWGVVQWYHNEYVFGTERPIRVRIFSNSMGRKNYHETDGVVDRLFERDIEGTQNSFGH